MATAFDHAAGSASDRRTLAVHRLELGQFRNYRRLVLETDDRPVVLFGPNGAGKTNLLEALSLLAPGRGLRGARLAEMDRRDGGPFRIAARLAGPAGPVEIRIRHRPEEGRRRIELDGRGLAGSAELADVVTAVWLTPAMDRLFLEGPAARRRLLDRLTLAVDPGHGRRVAAFERALRERLRLLTGPRADPAWLAVLERRIAALAVAILAARRQVVAGLAGELARPVMGFPALALEVRGGLEAEVAGLSALAAEEHYAARLGALRRRDAELGRTTLGPHRSDLLVRAGDSGEPAARCSSGRQKAMLCALLLAQIRLARAWRGQLPLVLLDEPMTHLDADRRRALAEAVVALGCQAWFTGTDREAFAPLAGRARFLHVDGARLDET